MIDMRGMKDMKLRFVLFFDISIQRKAHLCSLLPDCSEWLSLLDKAINFMPLVCKALDQCYLKAKLIFSFLPLLVWNALSNYWLFWLFFFFFNALDWNQLTSLLITENALPVSL